jgi:[lysine-biosynthesis-protein LysW]--L-2-aminoadipate ligase
MHFALIAHSETETNVRLVQAAPQGIEMSIASPAKSLKLLGPGDAALGRLDVVPTVDGIEYGTWEIARLAAEGVRVLNDLPTLLITHDKLQTSKILAASCLPHPRTAHLVGTDAPLPFEPPFVVKPRYGSWGRDVVLCHDRAQAEAQLERLAERTWFRRQGALVQELIPPPGHDLRIVVAGGTVVGAIQRIAAHGEWRTNVALGGVRSPVSPPPAARELALAAAAAAEADLVGVDLLPTPHGSWVVLELNGAVEFTEEYSLDRDVFVAAAEALVAAASSPQDEPLVALA